MAPVELKERRVHRRISAPARAHLIQEDGSRAELPVRDISLGGLFLFTRTLPAPIGTQVTVEIYLPNSTYVVRLGAELVRSVESSTPDELLGVGLRFVDPTREQRFALDELMLRLLEGPGGERRAYPRVSHRVSVRCTSAPNVTAVLRDLSYGGAGLWVDRPVPFGTSLSLEITRDKAGPLVLPGVVVAAATAKPGEPFSQIGVRFQSLAAEDQAALDGFLEDLVRKA